jgi:hypothetical protein
MSESIDISLLQPSFFGPTVIHQPLYIINRLTNEAHGYQAVHDLLAGAAFFDFNGWSPGIYLIENNSTATLPVVLFERTYLVNPGEIWNFIAHDEIGSHIAWLNTGTIGRIIESFWDVSLGGSIWDGGQSLWDIFPSGPGAHP